MWKFQEVLRAAKIIATSFWDSDGILLIKYPLQDLRITSTLYFDIFLHL